MFENLELADFGNRLPALTFEIIADDGGVSLSQLVQQVETRHSADVALAALTGFSYEGGPLVNTLAAIDSLYPLVGDSGGDQLTLQDADISSTVPIMLPAAASAWDENDFGGASGQNRNRSTIDTNTPEAVRYYDIARDFQPSIQRADGRARVGRTRTIEFPGTLAADDARALANAAAQRANWVRETLSWRMAELDPAITPGTIVRAPGIAGAWRVAGWEWREKGVELELLRLPPAAGMAPAGDPGATVGPADLLTYPTILRAFEVPWDGRGSGESPIMFAAASSIGSGWSGAALYLESAGALETLGSSGRARCITGNLTSALPRSEAILLEQTASVEVELASSDLQFSSATTASLSGGANRVIIGNEVVQFAIADQTSPTRWTLRGLLRGRGGTERAAQSGHPVGAEITLIDDSLVALDPARVPSSDSTFLAAIGRGDAAPVRAQLKNVGITRRPISPVHPRISSTADGGLKLCWSRRARGAWEWPDEVDTPLVEQDETYRIGVGPVLSPIAIWETHDKFFVIEALTLSDLRSANPGAAVWVRQVGNYAQSDALLLTVLS